MDGIEARTFPARDADFGGVVPDVSGGTVAEATSTLDQAGYLASTRDTLSLSLSLGLVVGTDPPAGTVLPPGNGVVVLVSAGPPPPVDPIPDHQIIPPFPDPSGTTVSAGATGETSNLCEVFAQAILDLRRAIPEREAKITGLQALIAAMQARPATDPARLQALIADLRQEEDLLESDQAQLRGFSEEFAAHCPPRPDI